MAESPVNPQTLVKPSPRYLAQVKAFLSYIEDVEADEETIEDILTGLGEEFIPSVTSDGEESGPEHNSPSRNAADEELDEDDDEFAQEGQVCFCITQLLEVLIWPFVFSQ
jgi:hypothetical protein